MDEINNGEGVVVAPMNGSLDGIKVVEWALDSPGSYCGKLLADQAGLSHARHNHAAFARHQ